MNNLTIKSKLLPILVFTFIGIGIYIRLDQFLLQILLDDEWHAVHQLLGSTPVKIATSFGHADYSIPLTLLYWLEAKVFGLSELMMRWPMMLFGLATLIVFPLYVSRHFSHQEGVLFAFLLMLSPVLILFSRTARPYSITLFLVYLSVWAFYKYYQQTDSSRPTCHFFYAGIYCISTSLAVWLHLIVAFFVVSPFMIETVRLFFKERVDVKRNLMAMFGIGLPTLLLTLLFVLPPILSNLHALTVKAGSHLPSFDTVIGTIYLWLGTESGLIVIVSCVLILIGLPRLFKQSIFTINILLGFILTFALILISEPAWVNHPLTLGRYLLPIIPVLLLSMASGLYVLQDKLTQRFIQQPGLYIHYLFVFGLMTGFIITSPVFTLLHHPNSNSLHSFYFFEFRAEKNIIEQYQRAHLYSEFWNQLEKNQPLSKKIAVAPWYFESHFWDAPVWEEMSNQYVVPGYLLGLCVKQRAGEVPDNQRFDFRNVSYLAKPQDLKRRGVDFIVYQKPNRLKIVRPYTDISQCDHSLQNIYGKPIYEDRIIKVFNPSPMEPA